MKDQTIRLKITEAARVIIAQKGYLTIKDIADYCHVNIAAVNYHFGSKNDLIQIVITDILNGLKTELKNAVKMYDKSNHELSSFLTSMLSLVYSFVFENKGVLKYLFINLDHQTSSSVQLIDMFFKDNEFVELVYESLQRNIPVRNPKELMVRYLMIFSSFTIPLFVELIQKNDELNSIDMFHDEEFKEIYINQLIKLIEQ